jgi:hypothetical protein
MKSYLLSILFIICGCVSQAPADSILFTGEIGKSESASIARFKSAPFDSLAWLRADLTFEIERSFTNYSGDISGRYIELMGLLCTETGVSPAEVHPHYNRLLKEIPSLQCTDGHFGAADINWYGGAIDFGTTSSTFKPRYLPTLWGNSRFLCGLTASYKAGGDRAILESARRLGDFYINLSERRLAVIDMIAEFTGIDAEEITEAMYDSSKRGAVGAKIDTYAAGYSTCYFPAIEGLVKLYQITKEQKYIETATRMAQLYAAFDVATPAHTHGMLCTYYSILLLSEATGDMSFLPQAEQRWEFLISNGFIDPLGGIAEGISNGISKHDEGCSEMDWLRLNIKLYELTGKTRYLDMADRLVHNHYIANQWSSGGFGHRLMLSDSIGVYGLGKGVAEATWCCDFHCTLGFLYYRQAIVSQDNKNLKIEFAENFTTPQLVSEITYSDSTVIQQLTFPSGFDGVLSIRIPEWAENISLKDATVENGYLRTEVHVSKDDILSITYSGIRYTENRILCKTAETDILQPVVFRYGQYILTKHGETIIQPVPTSLKLLSPIGSGSENQTAVFVFKD